MNYNNIYTPENLLKYMSEHIKYGYVGKNGKKYVVSSPEDWNDWYEQCLVQTGKDALDTNVGTCWDQVELERMWFETKGYEIKTFFVWFEIEEEYPTHTFLLYKNGNKWYWFENSYEIYRGIYEFNSVDEALDCVISKHLEYVINKGIAKPNDKQYIKAYEYSKLINSLNVDEYINHVTSGNKLN